MCDQKSTGNTTGHFKPDYIVSKLVWTLVAKVNVYMPTCDFYFMQRR